MARPMARPMARTVRKRRSDGAPWWVGVALIVAGAFVLLAVWQPGWTGWLGRSVLADGLSRLLGVASYEVGLVLMGMGWVLIKRRYSLGMVLVCGMGLLAGVSTIGAVLTGHAKMAWQWPPSTQGGGIVGWGLARLSIQLLGELGTVLWAAALVVAVPIGAFPDSFRRFWLFLKATPLPVRTRVPTVPPPKNPPVAGPLFSSKPVSEPSGDAPTPTETMVLEPPPLDTPADVSLPRLAVLPDLDDYQFPPLGLLDPGGVSSIHSKENVALRQEQAAILEDTLASFGVAAKVVNVTPGPSVTRYELSPGVGVKVAKITSLSKDIALKLAAPDVRIEAPIPGKALVGIEVPNRQTESVTLRALLEKTTFYTQASRLVAGMGLTITGEPVLMDLAKMPHVLIAGATGAGKSVCVNTFILSVLLRAKPDEVKFLMIDPKKVELSLYDGIPHLVAPVVTDPNKAAATLNKWALVEMERRYETFSKVGVKHIEGYNQWVLEKGASLATDDTHVVHQTLPYIVVIIDELADLMMVASSEVESTICRLAQMSRATGIHLVIATQRPSVDVVTGLIKANVPSRISFFLQSQIDSRTILDMPGAEKLLGKGDMLYSPVGAMKPQRVQGVYVSEREVKAVVGFLKAQASPSYIEAVLSVEPLESESKPLDPDQDELYEEAKQIIMNTQYASTSYLQRKLRIGYNRAARLMESLERQGVVSQYAQDRKKPLA